MSPDRTFYGGEAPVLATTGEIGGDRHYDGPTLGPIVAWNCPSCGVENTGPLEQGCVHCGAGKPGYHVAVDHTVPAKIEDSPAVRLVQSDQIDHLRGLEVEIYRAALNWTATHPDRSLTDAFVAGYQLASAQHRAQTMHAAPVTADIEPLAPKGKARRTILAALQLFRDQVLTQTPDEIESGEWCSLSEVDTLIAQYKDDHD